MLLIKRAVLIAALGIFLVGGLFAQDAGLDGDDLNAVIGRYITNVSNLIPDSTTLQNVWSYSPGVNGGWFGLGLNGSFTMMDRTRMSRIQKGGDGFGGSVEDLTKIPEGLPFLAGGAIDLRGGVGRFDFGLSGMWIDTEMLPALRNILGENSDYTYKTLGGDIRVAIFRDGRLFSFMPAITVQAGYYFTSMDFGFASSKKPREAIISLRNDTYMGALQISKELPLIKPFAGGKVIVSKTDSDFSWQTEQDVSISGREFPDGLIYDAKGSTGEAKLYFQVYGGLGLSLLFPHLITVGCAYNVVTEHFGANVAVRLLFAGN